MGNGADRALLRSAVFENLPEEAVQELCSRGRLRTFETDHVLFQRGDDAEELMILEEGVVELLFPVRILGVTRAVTMETKQPGDVVAWSALVNPYQFTLSARCASRCSLTTFSRTALNAFFESEPRTGCLFMRNLAGVIGRRLQAMQTMWMHDLQASVGKRMES